MDLQTRNHYMKVLGIPVWVPRDWVVETAEPAETVQAAVTIDTSDTPASRTVSAQPAAAAALAAVQRTIDSPAPRVVKPAKPASQPVVVNAPDCSNMDWSALQQAVSGCELCALYKSRTRTVFGTGDRQASWMIIGEAPGGDEDKQGEPFVGRAGKLLNNMLAAIGLPREAVYIANVLKCRPPNNRDPSPEESALCRGYLERQIALVKPALILVVGRIAAHNLLQVNTPLGRLRGTLHVLPGSDVPVLVTYHPAYLLRQPAEKRKAWQDLQLARRYMRDHQS